MAKADKAAAIAELSDKFRNSGAAVLTEYRGLTVKQITDLRNSLRGNATFAVVKNTLTELAAKDAESRRSTASSSDRPPSHLSMATRSRPPRACVTSPRRTPSS